jgi:Eukaryotic cytochrome b561
MFIITLLHLIFASSIILDLKPEGNVDSPDAVISYHDGNFLNDSVPVPAKDYAKKEEFQRMAFYHAILMFIAWIPAPLVGVFVARYLKKKLSKTWYRIHLTIMGLITGLGTLIGFGLIYSVRSKHFQSSTWTGEVHYKLGLGVTIVLVAVQIPLGFLADYYYDPNRAKVPIIDRAHRIVGIGLVLASIFNVWLGLRITEAKYLSFTVPIQILYYGFLLLGVGVFLMAETSFKSNIPTVQQDEGFEALVDLEDDIDSNPQDSNPQDSFKNK